MTDFLSNTNSQYNPITDNITDCQYFYICIAGQARRNGCQTGQVFNKETLACDSQLSVKNDPVCRSWYNDTFMEAIQGTNHILRHHFFETPYFLK